MFCRKYLTFVCVLTVIKLALNSDLKKGLKKDLTRIEEKIVVEKLLKYLCSKCSDTEADNILNSTR